MTGFVTARVENRFSVNTYSTKLVKIEWTIKKTCLKLVLLIHSPFLLPSFLGGKRKEENITSCHTFSDPIEISQIFYNITHFYVGSLN